MTFAIHTSETETDTAIDFDLIQQILAATDGALTAPVSFATPDDNEGNEG